jgi:hypothetical protein
VGCQCESQLFRATRIAREPNRAVGQIIARPAVEPHPLADLACHDPEAVVLDLMRPLVLPDEAARWECPALGGDLLVQPPELCLRLQQLVACAPVFARLAGEVDIRVEEYLPLLSTQSKFNSQYSVICCPRSSLILGTSI